LEKHPVSSADNPHRDPDIIEDGISRQGFEEIAADRVDGPCNPHRGVDEALVSADKLLVTPGAAEPVGDGCPFRIGRQDQLTAHRAHLRIGKGCDEHADGPGIKALACVGQDYDLSVGSRNDIAERSRLTAVPLEFDYPDAGGLVCPGLLHGSVGGAIGGEPDLQAMSWVVEG